jgi:MbtH protein
MTSPFDDEDGTYFVLVNDEGQHSLWPVFADVPTGWTVVHSQDTRQPCVDYVDKHWTDMRPRSLINAMNSHEQDTSFPA